MSVFVSCNDCYFTSIPPYLRPHINLNKNIGAQLSDQIAGVSTEMGRSSISPAADSKFWQFGAFHLVSMSGK